MYLALVANFQWCEKIHNEKKLHEDEEKKPRNNIQEKREKSSEKSGV